MILKTSVEHGVCGMAETRLGESLHRLFHAYKRALRQAYQDANIPLTISHIRTLKSIKHIPDCTAQAIATHTQRDKAQITRLVNDLIADGLVEKHNHPEDRRSHFLCLTNKGEKTMKRIGEIENTAGSRMVKNLNDNEVKQLVRLINIMTENLEP